MKKFFPLILLPIRFIEYLFYKVHPLWCTFAITEKCNAQCDYCQYWRTKHPELSTKDVLDALCQLKKLGIISVVFSGGECLLRPDLTEVVAHTTDLGMQATVVTNGLIGDESLFYDLMSRGLKGLVFSLDGSKPSIHEKFRKGCPFEKVIQSIQTALEVRRKYKRSTHISTTTVVNKTNVHDLQGIYQLRRSLGADKNYFQPIWPMVEEEYFYKRFGFSEMPAQDLENIAKELIRIPNGNLKKYYELFPHLYNGFLLISKKYQCFAGRAFVHVNSEGFLFPCSLLMDQPIGSLLQGNILTSLSGPEFRNKLVNYKQFKCGGCTMNCYMEKNIFLSSLNNPLGLWKRVN